MASRATAVTSVSRIGRITAMLSIVGAIATLVTSIGLLTASEAAAAPGGARVVVLGDSHAAGSNLPIGYDERECQFGVQPWPERFAQRIGATGDDYVNASCWGSSLSTVGYTLADMVRFAETRGALGPRTEHILIQAGVNDRWGPVSFFEANNRCWFDFLRGCDLEAVGQVRAQDPGAVTVDAYVDRTRQVVDYLRYHAPRARITIVGYPPLVPEGRTEVCVSVLGAPLVQPRGRAVAEFTGRLEEAQRGAAAVLGVGFVSLREVMAGHGPCSPQPWVNGILDFRANPFGMLPLHSSPFGDAVSADHVAAVLGV